MAHRPLNHTTILRHVLDKAVLGGAVLDVDILDRALARRHTGMKIHKLYFSIDDAAPHSEQIGASEIHWHPIPCRKESLSEDRAVLLANLRDAFVRLVAADPAFFDPARVAPGYLRTRFKFPPALPVFVLAARMVRRRGRS